MTNGEKFFEVFGDAPNFRLETVAKEFGTQYNFVAFLQEWWDDEYSYAEKIND